MVTEHRSMRLSESEASEAQFQGAVMELARRLSWKVVHFHDSRRQLSSGAMIGDKDATGWPDLVLVRNGWMIVAELKRNGRKCSPAQEAWLLALADVEEATQGRVKVTVWRPADWTAIVQTLQKLGRA